MGLIITAAAVVVLAACAIGLTRRAEMVRRQAVAARLASIDETAAGVRLARVVR